VIGPPATATRDLVGQQRFRETVKRDRTITGHQQREG
jgi:hypothetical protein